MTVYTNNCWVGRRGLFEFISLERAGNQVRVLYVEVASQTIETSGFFIDTDSAWENLKQKFRDEGFISNP